MTALRKLADLPPPERRLLLAAAALVPALRLALLALPFPVVTRAVARLAHLRATPADAPGPERIAWAVHAAARRVPLGAGCLAQALATQILLARCGHPARLRIGVARTTGRGFHAHAWVESGDGVALGESNLARFTALPTFSRDQA